MTGFTRGLLPTEYRQSITVVSTVQCRDGKMRYAQRVVGRATHVLDPLTPKPLCHPYNRDCWHEFWSALYARLLSSSSLCVDTYIEYVVCLAFHCIKLAFIVQDSTLLMQSSHVGLVSSPLGLVDRVIQLCVDALVSRYL